MKFKIHKTNVAVVLAAGKGQRLDAFKTIKPLVYVAGKPLILWNIERLVEAGVDKIYIVVKDKKARQRIQKRLFEYQNKEVDISYIEQPGAKKKDLLTSVLSIHEKIKEFKSPFYVTVCDLIFDKNPYHLFEKKPARGILILVSSNHKQNKIAGANTKMVYSKEHVEALSKELEMYDGLDVGVYRFTHTSFRQFYSIANQRKEISFERALETYGKRKKSLYPVIFNDIAWFDVNTPETLIRAELFMRKMDQFGSGKQTAKRRVRRVSKSIVFSHKKNVDINITIKRDFIKHLEKYAIIPSEYRGSPHHLIVDKTVDKLYGNTVYRKLLNQGSKIIKTVVAVGEGTKSIDSYLHLAEKILALGVDKQSIIISLGGGVVNNLAGFLAATIYRGIGLIHIPTTLMAQCDAAIGLKQGINGAKGKNLLGSFYEPMHIIVDPTVLLTLPERWLRDGLAECLKHALAQDKKFYAFFADYRGSIKDLKFLEYAVTKNIELKIKLMESDFKEDREALVLQYGHEVGHAIEYLSGYSLGHGESVAIGMRVAAELANIIGVADESVVKAHIDLLGKYGLRVSIPKHIDVSTIVNMLRYNKKFEAGEARLALVDTIGSLWHAGRTYTIPCREVLLRKAIENSYDH